MNARRTRWLAWASIAVVCAALVATSCEKVPIVDIYARFSLADASWFAEEQTLFIFYRVDAEQGIGPNSQIEVSYRTDVDAIPFTALEALPAVHTHLPVTCGPNTLCGSMSIKVDHQPRTVGIQLRYHRDGKLVLPADVNLNIIGFGPSYLSRSLLVYGVFDEQNQLVQWRTRHQFPTLRNAEVAALGLRRGFRINDQAFGDINVPLADNAYAYGATTDCADFTPLNHAGLTTTDQAIFDQIPLPFEASGSGDVCAKSTVIDAKGAFFTTAFARKNPDAKPPFPSLRSPIRPNTEVGVLLRPCLQTISETHRAMQAQRLLQPNELCIDDWQVDGFTNRLVAELRARIEAVRVQGNDMVLSIALHQDDPTGRLAAKVESALAQILPFERDKTTPRVSGAFLFDSVAHAIKTPELRSLALWCPALIQIRDAGVDPGLLDGGNDLDTLSSVAARTCPLLPTTPDLLLGPVKFNQLPILPSRAQYLTFIQKYSEAQAGEMTALTFLAPIRTPTSDNVVLGQFGVVSFFNDEQFPAEPTDRFSFCATPDAGLASQILAFRSQAMTDPLPLSSLPQFHPLQPQPSYNLGLAWDFPFLLKLSYQSVLGGNLTAFSLSVPFGFKSPQFDTYGGQMWEQMFFDVATVLLKCTRFCDHPTFDGAGVYNVQAPFDPTFQNQCYRPLFPLPDAGGFPYDP